MSRPFRVEVRTAAEAEIERRNVEEDRTHGRAFESVRDAIARIRSAKSAGAARLDSWMNHPDETVVLAALENEQVMCGAAKGVAGQLIVARALREKEEEGHLWTPVLDRASVVGLPLHGTPKAGQPSAWMQAVEGLTAWVAQQADPEALEELLSFEDMAVRGLVLRHGRVLPDETIERGVREQPFAVAQNPHIPDRWIEQVLRNATSGWEARALARASREAGRTLSPSFLDEMCQRLEDREEPAQGTLFDAPRHGVRHDAQALAILSASQGVPLERLYWLIPRVQTDMQAVELAKNPTANPAFLLELTKEHPYEAVFDCLIRRGDVLRDPALRQFLLDSSGRPAVMAALLGNATGDEWFEIFERLLGAMPEGTMTVFPATSSVAGRDLREVQRGLDPAGREDYKRMVLSCLTRLLPAGDPLAYLQILASGSIDGFGPHPWVGQTAEAAIRTLSREWDNRVGALIEVLEQGGPELYRHLNVSCLQPLLTHQDRTIRMRTATLISRFRPAATPEPPTRNASSPKP